MEFLREILPYVVGTLSSVFAWFAGRKKSNAEIESIEADNTKKILATNEEFIVKPIKAEINALRKEIKKLRNAIARVSECPHSDDCPVRVELQKHETDN